MKNLVYILLVLLFSACAYSTKSDSRLIQAESLLESDPKAAYEALNDMDLSTFADSADIARWALLYSEAMVANRYHAPGDTIIDIAVDYYSSHGLKEELRRANRLKSIVGSQPESDALVRALYLQKEKEYMLYREKTRRGFYLTGLILILIAGGSVVLWQTQRLRIRNMETEALIAEASRLREGLREQSSRYFDLTSKLSGILDTRFRLIDDLCGTYYESQGTKTERKAVAEKVKTQIESIRTDSGLFLEMERTVNDCRQDLLKFLRVEWPNMKPEDYRLTVYLASRLSTRTIALLLGESPDVVYKRKSRLKARIAASDFPHRTLFLSVF